MPLLGASFRRLTIFITVGFASILGIFLENSEPWSDEALKFPSAYRSHYFSAQALSILHGHLDVPRWVLEGECFDSDGKCFGYFGVTPSLLRIPVLIWNSALGLTGLSITIAILTVISGSALLANAIWTNVELGADPEMLASRWRPKFLFVAALTQVTLGTLAFQLLMPSVFDEALAWSAGFSIWGIYFVFKWANSARVSYLFISAGLFILAANARPTAGVLAVAVGLTVLIMINRSRGELTFSHWWAATTIALLPITSNMLVFWLKFRLLLPDVSKNYELSHGALGIQIREINGEQFIGAKFIPTMLWTYFRPDTLSYYAHSLNISLHDTVLWPAPEGGMYLEPTASLTNLMPAALLALALALIIGSRFSLRTNSRKVTLVLKPWITRVFIAASFAGTILVLANFSSSNRYLGDFIPPTVVVVGIAAAGLAVKSFKGTFVSQLLVGLLVVLTCIGIVLNLGLATSAVNARISIHRDELPTHSWLWG